MSDRFYCQRDKIRLNGQKLSPVDQTPKGYVSTYYTLMIRKKNETKRNP